MFKNFSMENRFKVNFLYEKVTRIANLTKYFSLSLQVTAHRIVMPWLIVASFLRCWPDSRQMLLWVSKNALHMGLYVNKDIKQISCRWDTSATWCGPCRTCAGIRIPSLVLVPSSKCSHPSFNCSITVTNPFCLMRAGRSLTSPMDPMSGLMLWSRPESFHDWLSSWALRNFLWWWI